MKLVADENVAKPIVDRLREDGHEVSWIAKAVDVPVTVDAEAGYGLAPTELVDRLLDAGANGCNIEDTDHATGKPRAADENTDRIASIRAAAGDSLVINARVDVFLKAGNESAVLPDAIDPELEALVKGWAESHAYEVRPLPAAPSGPVS